MAMDFATYQARYEASIADPEGFWGDVAKDFLFHKKWDRVKNTSFTGDVSISWFEGAKLNITENAIDRHLAKHADKAAIIFESDDGKDIRHISFQALHDEVCRTANALKELGVKRGDVVTIYMPMVPEAAYAMLACARIGAVHSVVFAGFAAESIRTRVHDGDSKVIITADEVMRGGKAITLKDKVDEAVRDMDIRHILTFKRTGGACCMQAGRDVWWHDLVRSQPAICPAEIMDAQDPLFVLYTSGSTGKPKGLVHQIAGYMVYVATTHRIVFDIQPDSVFWCSADVGWITGHSYVVYGSLLNGCTTLMFEGTPTYPDASRFWQVIDRHQVTEFYTAPTAIRALMRFGDGYVNSTSRASLRVLGTVGEPINPEAWHWYHDIVGKGQCALVDTWWQTETGGHLLTPIAGTTPTKPGSATLPFFGVQPTLYSADGTLIEGEGEGLLCFADSWPGQACSILGNHARFVETYFSTIAGQYFSGDGARRDADGYYWITGRLDDVINVSGHRLGTAEIEAVLDAHEAVSEAAVVGIAHDIKGQGIYAYVILNENVKPDDALISALKQQVRKHIGALAVPDHIHITPGLPKTRSGKIMRRILRKIAENQIDDLGDISTLLNPEMVAKLIDTRN
jgi:acetyl-CoA synthetase